MWRVSVSINCWMLNLGLWMAKRYEDFTIEQYDLRNVWSRSVWRSVFVLRALRMHGASTTGMQHDATKFCMHPCLYQMVFLICKVVKKLELSHRLSLCRGLCTHARLWLWEGLQWLASFVVQRTSALLLLGTSPVHLNLTHQQKISGLGAFVVGKKVGIGQHMSAFWNRRFDTQIMLNMSRVGVQGW